jgi:hypothetical protein
MSFSYWSKLALGFPRPAVLGEESIKHAASGRPGPGPVDRLGPFWILGHSSVVKSNQTKFYTTEFEAASCLTDSLRVVHVDAHFEGDGPAAGGALGTRVSQAVFANPCPHLIKQQWQFEFVLYNKTAAAVILIDFKRASCYIRDFANLG